MIKKYKTSAITFVRKALDVKGRTIHNGRGGYECSFVGISNTELIKRVRDNIDKWQNKGLVQEIEDTEKHIRVVLTDSFTCEYYRAFYFNKVADPRWNEYFCTMVFPELSA